jgi:hypothetical protein
MGAALVTRAEYKAYVGITSTNSDAIIDAILQKVSDYVKTYCRRSFVDYVSSSKVEITNGGYGNSLILNEYPVISINNFEMSTDYGQTYTALVAGTDYVLDIERSSILNITGNFAALVNGYKITYRGGFVNLPEDLKLAVFDLMTYYIKNDMAVHSPKAPGTNSVQVEYITNSALPAHIRRILDLYKASWD